jgi:hypothetical protein
MARRKIHTTRVGRCSVGIYKDSEYGEFIVQSQGAGKDTGYFTDTKQDARNTAAFQARRLRKDARCK